MITDFITQINTDICDHLAYFYLWSSVLYKESYFTDDRRFYNTD